MTPSSTRPEPEGLPATEAETAGLKIPVWQEELHVGTRTVDAGSGVRIHKTVSEEEQTIDPPLERDELSVETVPVGQWVDSASPPQARYEGDTLIVPVLEEVLVVEKKLRVKEELRITRRRQETHAPQKVTLRSEHVTVERFDSPAVPGAFDTAGAPPSRDG